MLLVSFRLFFFFTHGTPVSSRGWSQLVRVAGEAAGVERCVFKSDQWYMKTVHSLWAGICVELVPFSLNVFASTEITCWGEKEKYIEARGEAKIDELAFLEATLTVSTILRLKSRQSDAHWLLNAKIEKNFISNCCLCLLIHSSVSGVILLTYHQICSKVGWRRNAGRSASTVSSGLVRTRIERGAIHSGDCNCLN